MTAVLNAGLDQNIKPLVEAQHESLGTIYLHENQILQGVGKDKRLLSASYQPQSGIAGPITNAQFDILIPNTSGNGGINIINELYLQMDISITSSGAPNNVTLKPLHQWFNRVDISQDGSDVLQSVYFDKAFIDVIQNSFNTSLDNVKSQINLDPHNFLSWFDDKAAGLNITIDNTGAITLAEGLKGASTYLGSPYFQSSGDATGVSPWVDPGPPVKTGKLEAFIPYAKGGYLSSDNKKYRFYLPLRDTVLQTAQILMNKISSNIRFRFYMNNEVKLYDSGTGPSTSNIKIDNTTLWVFGQTLSNESLNILDAKYLLPVVSSFNYYLQFTQDFNGFSTVSPNTAVLSPLTGLCTSLTFWLEDTRQDIAYPRANSGGDRYINNNMMTLPIGSYQFIAENGQIVGSGNYVPDDLLLMQNNFGKAPKTNSGDNKLYFRKYYRINFGEDAITTEAESVFSSTYRLTGRESLRIYGVDGSLVPSTEFPNVELNEDGNQVDQTVADLYSSVRLHVTATIMGECIQSNGLLSVNLPRT